MRVDYRNTTSSLAKVAMHVWSDKIALTAVRARPVSHTENPVMRDLVEALAGWAQLAMPFWQSTLSVDSSAGASNGPLGPLSPG